MKSATLGFSLLVMISAVRAQTPRQEFSDPVALLQVVAKTYGTAVDTFRMESIAESEEKNDLHHEWRKIYRTVIKGPGALYRIETRSPFGSYIQDSDGKNEWVYLIEAKAYLVRPLPEKWPQLPRISVGGQEISQAWNMRTWLDATAGQYKRATMLPQETITIEGRSYPCYVVHVTSEDSSTHHDKDARSDTTFWIDKTAHVFRKEVEHSDSYIIVTPTVHIPIHNDRTTIYPVVDFSPQTTAQTFQFVPPTDAKQVASLEPDIHLPPSIPQTQMVGKIAPDVSFTTADGKKVDLSSYRGKPLLIDLWATWCGPCLLSMPALNRIYVDARNKGLTVVTFDQDIAADDATEYLARHGYSWTNYHDTDKKVMRAFKDESIPLTVLIDAQGKIAYYDLGGDEAAVRKAIAAQGADFSSLSAPAASKTSVNSSH